LALAFPLILPTLTFPVVMRFAFAWITNNVGRWILILQVVIGLISALTTLGSYFSERRALSKHRE
jgi:hypothetical protein